MFIVSTGATEKDKVTTCDKCDGHGIVIMLRQIGPGFVQQIRRPCPACEGRGEMIEEKYRCKKCDGKKVIPEKKELTVYIEKGMRDGHKIPFEGEADETVISSLFHFFTNFVA